MWSFYVGLLAQFRSALTKEPVIIVPGVLGSVLEARLDGTSNEPHKWCSKKSDWYRVWLDLPQMTPTEKPCFLHNLGLTYNESDGLYHNMQGVFIRPLDFGGVDGMMYLDPFLRIVPEFKTLVRRLMEDLGYVIGQDLHGAPYDWRLSGDGHAQAEAPGGFYKNLKSLIETSVIRNGNKSATIVTHSLGGPTILYFLHKFVDENWRRQYVKQWLAISPAFAGSVVQIQATASGYNFQAPIPEDYLRKLTANSPSGVWLMPSPSVKWEEPLVQTPTRNYTSRDMLQLYQDLALTEGAKIYQKMRREKSLLDDIQSVPAGVNLHVLTSSGLKTKKRFVYKKDFDASVSDSPHDIEYGDGDGTVNIESLKAYEQWPNAQEIRAVNNFEGISHGGMCGNRQVISYLKSLLALKPIPPAVFV